MLIQDELVDSPGRVERSAAENPDAISIPDASQAGMAGQLRAKVRVSPPGEAQLVRRYDEELSLGAQAFKNRMSCSVKNTVGSINDRLLTA